MSEVTRVVNSVFNSCSYVVGDDERSWLIDCGDVDSILPLIKGRLCGVLLTHAHFDHIYGLNQLLSIFPHARVYTNAAGREALLSDKLNFSRYYGDPFTLLYPENVDIVADGQMLPLYGDTTASAVETPGHSPSCVTWIIGESVFTGDSHIPGVKTVTNIPHSDKDLAHQSEARILQLAEHRLVYPGHAAPTEL